MARTPTHDHVLRLLGRALALGAVVELAGRALVLVPEPGVVLPRDRSGTWPCFAAAEVGIYACCPLWTAAPTALLSPACRGWLRLGEVDELPELLPVAEWLAALGEAETRAFALGLLHGLDRLADGSLAADGVRPVIRTPESLARELLG
jgi:hypothetical protein